MRLRHKIHHDPEVNPEVVYRSCVLMSHYSWILWSTLPGAIVIPKVKCKRIKLLEDQRLEHYPLSLSWRSSSLGLLGLGFRFFSINI
jgi:hypothetical protein